MREKEKEDGREEERVKLVSKTKKSKTDHKLLW